MTYLFLIAPPRNSAIGFTWQKSAPSHSANKNFRRTKLLAACLGAFGGIANAFAAASTVEVVNDTLILSGTHELLGSTGTTYTVTDTDEKVKAEDFKTVILNATPTDEKQRAVYPWSMRWDAPNTHLIINVTSKYGNCDGIHLSNWNPHVVVGKLTAHIDGGSTSDAVNLSHDGTTAYATFGEVDLTVEKGHGLRANAKVSEGQSNTITVSQKAKITINGSNGSTAVFAGDSQRYFKFLGRPVGSETKGRGDLHLLGETYLYLNGRGNYGINAGKNGNIDVKDLHIESSGADSYGVAATNRNITYWESWDKSANKFGSVVTMSGKTNFIHMNGKNGTAILADSEYGRVISAEEGLGSMDVVGNIEASNQGTIDLKVREQTSIVGTMKSSGAADIAYAAQGGMTHIAPMNEENQYATAVFAGDNSQNSSGKSTVSITYGAISKIQGDFVAAHSGVVSVSPNHDAGLMADGDAIAANGGEINLHFGNGSYWEGRADDFIDADSGEWAAPHQSIFKIEAPEFSANVTASGSVKVNLGSGSTWKVTGQSWVSSIAGSNNVIDLTGTGDGQNVALHIGEINGSNNTFLMNLSRDGTGNMIYVYNGTASAQNLVIANSDEALSMDVGERIRFATVANAGNGFNNGTISGIAQAALFGMRTTVADQGVFNVDYAIEYADRDTDQEDVDYDGGSSMTAEKPGSDYVSSIYDSDENADSQNVYIVRTGNSSLSDAGETIMATARATYWNAVLIDRWNQRYGDRVYDENRNGVWARVKHERLGTNECVGDFRSYNTMYQFGYDYSKPTDHGKMIWGGALDYMDGHTDYKSIKGDGGTDRTALSLYATYLSDSGFYGDLVFRAGRLSSNFKMYAPSGVKLDVDYDNWLYGFSFETGHRLENGTGWFIEPQLQAQYIRITNGNYTTQQNTRVNQDAIDSLIGRAGFRVGKFISDDKSSLAYVKADVLREFMGDQKIHVADRTTGKGGSDWDLSNHDTWFDVGAGFQAAVAENLFAYGDVEYRFGNDLERTWVFNLGAKYRF